MDTITADAIQYSGRITKLYEVETLQKFSYTFSMGRSYLLSSEKGCGALALTWIIGGETEPNFGEVKLNGMPYPMNIRRHNTWCVRGDEIKRKLWRYKSTKEQIREALKGNSKFSEQDLIDVFRLRPELYERPVTQLSHEGHKSSCAIGVANGKMAYCLRYLDAEIRFDLMPAWLIKTLTDLGKLVLIPTKVETNTAHPCDEIIQL
jgi:ABC-type dipeptide/oligopeptide/nickel transport system ATPase subunit